MLLALVVAVIVGLLVTGLALMLINIAHNPPKFPWY